MKIAVDFDGTIVEHRYPHIGAPIPFAIETLIELSKEGHEIILWTAREGKTLKEAVEFCHQRGLDFWSVNSDFPGEGWSKSGARKLNADVYIDDKNIGGLPEWSEIYSMISNQELPHASAKSRNKKSKWQKSLSRFVERLIKRCNEARYRLN